MKKKQLIWRLAIVLCAVLLLLVQPAVSQAGLIDSLMQKIDSTKSQKADTESKLKENRAKALTVQEQLAEVNRSLDEQTKKINEKETEIVQLQQEIATEEAKIQSDEKQLQVKRDQFDKIVVSNYQNGPSSYLEVLFGARNFNDFLNRISYLKLILTYENGVIQSVASDQKQLTAENNDLHSRQDADQNNLTDLNSLKVAQLAAQKQKQILLQSLKQQENQEVEELNAENRAMQQLSAQIAALEEKYAGGNQLPPSGGWVWPVPSSNVISSGYGWRTLSGRREFHNGLDIAAPLGTPIVAAASGVVLYAGPAEGFGHWIVIEHSKQLLTVYGHMYASGILVQPGDKVSAGQEIAEVGSDGYATGPHLHFSVITGFDSNGYMITVDPNNYI